MEIQVTFTPEQAQKNIALIDSAVRAGGLNVAEAALEIAQLIQAAMQAKPEHPQ